MKRRDFLSSVAALPAISAIAQAQTPRPASSRTGLKLGTVTYNIAKDWDVPTIIKNLTEVGMDAVELRTTHKHGVEISLSPAARAEVRKRFEDSPVKIGGLGTTCEYHSPDPAVVRKNIDETKEWVKLAHDLGSSSVKVRPNGLPKDTPTTPIEHAKGITNYVVGGKRETQLALANLGGTAVILWLMERT